MASLVLEARTARAGLVPAKLCVFDRLRSELAQISLVERDLVIPSVVCDTGRVSWGTVESEPEVTEWLEALRDDKFGRVEFYIDLLAKQGPLLAEPYTRQLRGKLRELRFYLGPTGDAVRITYYIARGRRIVLLTVFRKQRRRERAEIERAEQALQRCIAEGHIVEDEDD
jgi:hypothetical protein